MLRHGPSVRTYIVPMHLPASLFLRGLIVKKLERPTRIPAKAATLGIRDTDLVGQHVEKPHR